MRSSWETRESASSTRKLRLGARDQDILIDSKRDAIELLRAGDVLRRLSGEALLHTVVESLGLLRHEKLLGVPVEMRLFDAEDSD